MTNLSMVGTMSNNSYTTVDNQREPLWNRKQPSICQFWKASNLLASYASTVEGTVMLNIMPVLCNLLVMHTRGAHGPYMVRNAGGHWCRRKSVEIREFFTYVKCFVVANSWLCPQFPPLSAIPTSGISWLNVLWFTKLYTTSPATGLCRFMSLAMPTR